MASDMGGFLASSRAVTRPSSSYPSKPNSIATRDMRGFPAPTQDPFFDKLVLGIHGGVATGSTISDYSKYARAITPYGGFTYAMATPFFDGSYLSFDGGSTSHAEVASGIDFSSGGTPTSKGIRDFVVDFYAYQQAGFSGFVIINIGAPGSGTGSIQDNRQGVQFGFVSSGLFVQAGNLSRDGAGGYIDRRSIATFVTNQWNHFRFAAQSNILYMWINGKPTAHTNGGGANSTISDFTNVAVYRNSVLNIAGSNFLNGSLDTSEANGTGTLQCRIQELRIYMDAFFGQSEFIPPTRPYSDF